MFAAPRKYSAWQMDKAIKRNSGERKKFVGVLCLFDFGRILKDFFKRVENRTALPRTVFKVCTMTVSKVN